MLDLLGLLCRRYGGPIFRNFNTTAPSPKLGQPSQHAALLANAVRLEKSMLAMDFGNESPAGPDSSGQACPVCGVPGHVEKVSSLVRRNSGTVVVGGTAYPYFSNL